MNTQIRIGAALLLMGLVGSVVARTGAPVLAAPGVGRVAQQVATPTPNRNDIQVRKVLDTGGGFIRMVLNPFDNQVYALNFGMVVNRLNLQAGTTTADTSFSFAALPGFFPYGLAFGTDGTAYMAGNVNQTETNEGVIYKGVLNATSGRTWSLLARTEPTYKSRTAYDHVCNGVAVSPDNQFVFLNCGSRTDHGEVQDNEGVAPNLREQPLTSAILRVPASANNLLLQNNESWLQQNGYLYADGIRNTYDMAFAANGDLIGGDNGPDADYNEELNWLRPGLHYGFPWRMGNEDNLQQFPAYNPAADVKLPPNANAVVKGYYRNDPTFPAKPAGLSFVEPIASFGPDADFYRAADGTVKDASSQGQTLSTFTGHRSPLGLSFDLNNELGAEFRGDLFVLSYGNASGNFADVGRDLLHIKLSKTNGQYQATSVKQLVTNFNGPIDSVIRDGKIYVLEFDGAGSVWEVSLPVAAVATPTPTPTLVPPTLTPIPPTVTPPIGACTVNIAGGAQFTKIQDAVNDASCTTVNVAAGTYTENITITRSVNVIGTGKVVVDGNSQYRVFTVVSGTVSLTNMTIQRGYANHQIYGLGGGVYNAGKLSLDRVTISGNWSRSLPIGVGRDAYAPEGFGGGIYNKGELYIQNSTISGNEAYPFQYRQFINLRGKGSGIYNDNLITLTHSTVANNLWYMNPFYTSVGAFTATTELYNSATGIAWIANSILNGQDIFEFWSDVLGWHGSDWHINCEGTVIDLGNNLSNDSTCTGTTTDPKLDPSGLKDNGGNTPTIALQPDSPALGAANPANCPATDQRGVTRPQGAGCDIGAFERKADDATPPTATPIPQTRTPAPPTSTPTPQPVTAKITILDFLGVPLQDWRVTVARTDNNAVVAEGRTDANGALSLSFLAGNYKVCQEVKTGWQSLFPTDACFWQSLQAGASPQLNFINEQLLGATATPTPTPTPIPPTLTPIPPTATLTNRVCAVNAAGGAQFTKIQDAINDRNCATVIVATLGSHVESRIVISRNVNITGLSGSTPTTIDADYGGRVFDIQQGASVNISNLTLIRGKLEDFYITSGAGIQNAGNLTLSNCTLSNHSAYQGAAVFNTTSGHATITACVFKKNSAYFGSALMNFGVMTVTQSAMVFNYGDTVSNFGASLRIVNSTVASNQATNQISAETGRTTIINTTIGNFVRVGDFNGNIVNIAIKKVDPAVVVLQNTLIAKKPNGVVTDPGNCSGPVTDGGNNLSTDSSCGVSVNADLRLELYEPSDNGGNTLTLALGPDSPAIDAANPANCPATDQRGVTRPQGAVCDIGAYEYVGIPGTRTPTPPPAPITLIVRVFANSYAPLPNWPVTVYDMSRGEAVVATANTNADGTVVFALGYGNYKICETVQNGYAVSYPPTNCYWQTLGNSNPIPSLLFLNVPTTPMTPTPTPTEPTVCTSLSRSLWVASSSYGGNTALAIDPSPTTFWNNGVSRQGQGQWFSVDLGEQKTINGLTLGNASDPSNYPRKIGVYVSADGGVFTKVGEATPTGATTTFSFAKRTARYVSVEILQSNFTASWSIGDFDVCAGGAAPAANANAGQGIGKQYVLKAQGFVPLQTKIFLPVLLR